MYWEVGAVILRQQREEGWGARVIARLSADLQKEFPDLKGLSVKNLNYMRAFAAAFPDFSSQRNVVENALVRHLKSFMLELGKGFAYVGRQKNLVVEGDDFFLDLLFYNYHLHCFVVFELKVGAFKPAYAGTLNFYVNSINAQLKGPDDRSTIGVLLCKTPNETVVRYALMGLQSPIGVADYQLTLALPKQLKDEMPTVEELEAELDKEYETLKSGDHWALPQKRSGHS